MVQIARDRAGEPDAELHLEAREFFVISAFPTEDSVVTLKLLWTNPTIQYFPKQGPADWFDRAKLEETGFDVAMPPESSQATEFYSREQSREVFVALELGGPFREKWLASRKAQLETQPNQNKQQLEEGIENERQTGTRLIAIDVSRDPAELRRKYPNRQQVIILRGLARLQRENAESDRPPRLRGYLMNLVNDSLYLNREFRPLANRPFLVTVAEGTRYEPWIVDLKKP
jgi:hypothetical protein